MQPVRQESNGRRMCSSSLVTASSTSAVWFPDVSKHPGAVLLLAAQQSTLLTFNESLIIFFFLRRSDAASFCFDAARLWARQVTPEDHSCGNHGDSAFWLCNKLPLHKSIIGRAVPQDPSAAVLLRWHLFSCFYRLSTDLNIACSPVSEASSPRPETSPLSHSGKATAMTSPSWAASTQMLSEETYDFHEGTAHHFSSWNPHFEHLFAIFAPLGKALGTPLLQWCYFKGHGSLGIVPNECVSNHMNGKQLWVVR